MFIQPLHYKIANCCILLDLCMCMRACVRACVHACTSQECKCVWWGRRDGNGCIVGVCIRVSIRLYVNCFVFVYNTLCERLSVR